MKRILSFLLFLTIAGSCFAQATSRQIKNLEAFTKLYGYVQYFHPADGAPKDWALLAIYGSKKMLSVQDDKALVQELKDLFTPIAPSVKIYLNTQPERFSLAELSPADLNGYETITWQHFGFGLPMSKTIYTSTRLHRDTMTLPFSKHAAVGEYLQKELVPGVSCIVPYALYGNKEATYPVSDTALTNPLFAAFLAALPKDLAGKLNIKGEVLEIRLADIAVAWNVLKHAFPYWEDSSKPADEVLTAALKKAFFDRTSVDFLKTLQLMCAPLNDGHMMIDLSDGTYHDEEASAPLVLTKAEEKILVKEVLDSSLEKLIFRGDLIDSIDHLPAQDVLTRKEQYVSGSPQWKEYKGLVTLLNGPEKSHVALVISRNGEKRSLDIVRSSKGLGYRNGSFAVQPIAKGWIKPGVFYINLSSDSIPDELYRKELSDAQSIIFDLRGYPLDDNAFKVVNHLLTKAVSGNCFFVPKIIYPNLEKVSYSSDTTSLLPEQPLLKAKVYVLTDASAQSASETLLGQIKGFKLATIIGQPTSGSNGNMNIIVLPGRYRMGFTGMLVKNHDGSKHHLNGILPDVKVLQTIKGIQAGKDEVLEAAIERAMKK